MIGEQFVTTANYADSQVDVDREVSMHISVDQPVYCQIARINHRDGSRHWEATDTPFPAADFSLDRIAGVRFKSNGATPANVFVIWSFHVDDALIRRLSTNAPFTDVDDFLPLTGGVMSGDIVMSGHKISSLAAATAPGDALRYEQLFGANLFGGDLSGTFPNPVIIANAVTLAKIAAAVTLDAIATGHPTVADIVMNGHKLTGLAAGTVNGDSLRYEQLIGAVMGGDLTGTFPNPTIGANKVTLAKIAAAVTLDAIATAYATVADIVMNAHKLTGLAAGTVNGDSVRFEQAVKVGDAAGGDLTGTYLNPTIGANKVTLAKIAAAVTLDAIAAAYATAADIPMNAHKLTGLAAGAANGDSVRFEQLATAGTYPLTKLNVPVVTVVNNTAVGLSFAIIGGTLKASSILRIRFCVTVAGSAGNYTLTLSLGGTTIKTTTGTQLSAPTYNGEILLVCQNATNSQLWHYGALSGSTVWWTGLAPIASAKDLTVNQTLVLQVSSSDTGNGSGTVQFVSVEVEP